MISSILCVINETISYEVLNDSLIPHKINITYPLVPPGSLMLERPFFDKRKTVRFDKSDEIDENENYIYLMNNESINKVLNYKYR